MRSRPPRPRGDKRRALGTALALTASIGLVGTALFWPLAPTLSDALIGDNQPASYMRTALGLGAIGAVWRLAVNLPRLERRPLVFVGMNALRPLVVIGLTLAALSSGAGIGGVLTANLVGSGVVLVLALLVSFRSYRVAFSREDTKTILIFGRSWVPLVLALWVANNADVLVLNHFAAAADVGNYRLASRLCVALSFASSAIFMAWLPFRRSAIFDAVSREHGRRINALLAQYYVIFLSGLLLLLAVLADLIVGFAPPAYQPAAALVPLVGLAVAVHGFFYLAYRVSKHPSKRRDYVLSAVVSALIMVGLAALLVPALGGTGAALAPIAGFSLGTVYMVVRSQRGPKPIPFDAARTILPALVAGGLFAAERLAPVDGDWGAAGVGLAALVAYPVILVVSGLVPRGHVHVLRQIGRGALPTRGVASVYAMRVALLPQADQRLLRFASRRHAKLADVARQAGTSTEQTAERLVRTLRAVGELEIEAAPYDEAIGANLLADASVAERDLDARAMFAEGLPAQDYDDVVEVLSRLRRHRRVIFKDGRRRPDQGADRLRVAISTLNRRERALLEVLLVQDLPPDEVASLLGVETERLRGWQADILAKLSARLDEGTELDPASLQTILGDLGPAADPSPPVSSPA